MRPGVTRPDVTRVDTECGAEPARSPRVSRRRLLVGAAVAGGVVATQRIGSTLASTPLSKVDDSAGAVETAYRIDPPEFVPAPTSTLPPPTFEPPAPGEILFPLFLGGGATCLVLDNYGDTRGRCCGYYHQGVDIMAPENTPQFAAADGVLTKRYDGGFFGWTLTGDDGVTYKYFHNTPDDHGLSVGDRVQLGDVIGFVGDSGTSTGNFHLHFEYRPNNVPADPYAKLQRVPGATFSN